MVGWRHPCLFFFGGVCRVCQVVTQTLEYGYAGKTWIDVGPKKRPNKWVTLRALRVLQAVA